MNTNYPLKTLVDSFGTPIGVQEFQPGDTVPLDAGGTGVKSLAELRKLLEIKSLAYKEVEDLEVLGFIRESSLEEHKILRKNEIEDLILEIHNREMEELNTQEYHFKNVQVWVVKHNRNTRSFQYNCYSPENYGFDPFRAKMIIVDENTFEVHLSKPLTGFIRVDFNESCKSKDIRKEYQFFTPSKKWLVTHNMNTNNFTFELFSPGRYGDDPFRSKINIIDENSFEFNFTTEMTGFVRVLFHGDICQC